MSQPHANPHLQLASQIVGAFTASLQILTRHPSYFKRPTKVHKAIGWHTRCVGEDRYVIYPHMFMRKTGERLQRYRDGGRTWRYIANEFRKTQRKFNKRNPEGGDGAVPAEFWSAYKCRQIYKAFTDGWPEPQFTSVCRVHKQPAVEEPRESSGRSGPSDDQPSTPTYPDPSTPSPTSA